MSLDTINFPLINAALNSLAAVLLIAALVAVRRRKFDLHKRLVLGAFGASTVFLASYLTYHYMVGHTRFVGPDPVRYAYYGLLLTHVLLAVTVPPLALVTIWLGFRAWPAGSTPGDERLFAARRRHRRLARWTFPIWLYVSVTGVVIYVVLYHLYPAVPGAAGAARSGEFDFAPAMLGSIMNAVVSFLG